MRRIWIGLLILALPLAFVSGLWSAPDAAVWLDKLKALHQPEPVVAKDEDLKCLNPGLCVGDKAPEALAHLGCCGILLQAVICQPDVKNATDLSPGAVLAGRKCPSGDYEMFLVTPAYVDSDRRPREAVDTEIRVRGGKVETIHCGPPPFVA